MYTNNNARFPIGDSGDELELIEMLTRGHRCNRSNTSERNSSCECEKDNNDSRGCTMPHFDDSVSLAIVYSPDHEFKNMYDVDTALERATLFKALDKPFMGTTVSGGNCR